MQVELISERQFYQDQAGRFRSAARAWRRFVAIVMGIGAVFGAMNTMYGIVAARTREIGTLRALGFSRSQHPASFVLESAFLALVGGLLGCLVALPANGYHLVGRRRELRGGGLRVPHRARRAGHRAGLRPSSWAWLAGCMPALKAARLPITNRAAIHSGTHREALATEARQKFATETRE